MRLVVVCLLLSVLAACAVPATSSSEAEASSGSADASSAEVDASDLAGLWTDENAILETCGTRSPAVINLTLEGEGETLEGQFELASRAFPFEGRVREGVSGMVSAPDGSSLSADLALEGGRLLGTFIAAGDISCTDGTRSKTVYEVAMER